MPGFCEKRARLSTHRSLSILQHQYALNILERYGFANCDAVSTPMDPGLRLSADMASSMPAEAREMQSIPHGQAVGSLFYLLSVTLNLDTKQPGHGAKVSQLEVLAQVVLDTLNGCFRRSSNGDVVDKHRDDEADSISQVDPHTVLTDKAIEA